MTHRSFMPWRPHVNRRAFLRGAAGVSLALPFLEGLPERSAWAVGNEPVFSLFICAVGGIVPASFFPDQTGVLTVDGLSSAGKATSELSAHAERLLFVTGIDLPPVGGGDMHPANLCAALTGRQATGGGTAVTASGPSADVVIASRVHPDLDPITVYSGNPTNGFIEERLSFSESGAVRAAVSNPYDLYQELIGLVGPGGEMTPEGEEARRLLLSSRNSIHDLVREDLIALINNSRLSKADRERLDLHLQGIRDAEIKMDGMGEEMLGRCTSAGLDITKLEAMKGVRFSAVGYTEPVTELHMSLVALAFACNHRRTATLQWGDAYDLTVYEVPSNERAWKFSFIGHRTESDSSVGTDQLAALAHAEIDKVRMQTLANGLDHFAARDLGNRAFVLWMNHFEDVHRSSNIPHIIWGSGGGYLKQGEYLDAGGVGNGQLLTTLINAAVQDTGATVEDFGSEPGLELAAIRA